MEGDILFFTRSQLESSVEEPNIVNKSEII